MRTHCITIDLANQGRRQAGAASGGRMSSDGGALLLQAVDQGIGLTQNARLKRALAAVPRFSLSDAGELEPQAAGGGQGGVAAGRGARGHGEPDQGAAAGPVRGGAAGGVATTRAGGDGAGAGAVRDDPGAAAEGGRGGAGERAEGLGVVVLGVSAPGAVRAQPGAVAGGDAGTAGVPRVAARGRCVHPAPIRRAGRAECPGTGPG